MLPDSRLISQRDFTIETLRAMADTTSARLLPLLLASLFILVPSSAFAQDGTMTFGVEDVKESSDEAAEEPADDGTMSFGTQDVLNQQNAQDSADQSYTVGVVMIPSDQLGNEQRIELQNEMQAAVGFAPNYQAQNGEAVLRALENAGMATCITEPLCLASAGREAGVERILMGRLKSTPTGLSYTIDLFDVSNKLFVKYTAVNRLSNYDAVLESVEPAMKDIFNIRVARKGPNYGEEASSGTVQKVLAYTAAGLSVAALAGGIYFGLDASSIEDGILEKKNESGGFTISQVEADRQMRAAQDSALTANIMYGAAAGLAVVSGILFYVESGSDVATPDQRRRAGLLDAIEITPQVGFGRVGLGAGFDF
jgi:hypothetical protein